MTKSGITVKTLASVLFTFALCATVQAQNRVFVSGVGNDANPCSRTAPCRNFQKGHDVVAAGGEVVALDSGDYGVVSITKSVTITGEGVYAGITATSGNAINITSATAVVVLRNLSIYGLGTGNNLGPDLNHGINVTDASSLHVENCAIQGFSFGLFVNTTANLNMQTFVKDTVIRINNNTEIGKGRAVFENCRFERNLFGLLVSGGAKAVLHNCVIAGSGLEGLRVKDTGSKAMVDNCQISNGLIGIRATDTGQVRVSNSNITGNSTGLNVLSGGTILSRVSASGALTNTVEDSVNNGAFTGTYSAK